MWKEKALSGNLPITFVLVTYSKPCLHLIFQKELKLSLSTGGAIQVLQEPVLSEKLKKGIFVKRAAKRLTSQNAVLMKKELVISEVFAPIL